MTEAAMTEIAWVQLVVLAGWLILAASALASFRLNWSQAIRMVLIWAAIFLGVAFVVSAIL